MATPGPKPKPTEQAIREGVRKDRVPNPPLRSGPGVDPEMPPHLNQFQQDAWAELIDALKSLDVLDNADLMIVETAAAMLGRMREARKELLYADMVEVTQRGASVPSPWWKIEREASLQVHKLLAELGLSPSARARLANSGAKSKKPDEMLDDFLGAPGRLKVLEGGT